jgi:pilus assembly protein CpaE
MKKNPDILVVENERAGLFEAMKDFRREFEAQKSSYTEAQQTLMEAAPQAVILNIPEHHQDAKKILRHFRARLPQTRWTVSAKDLAADELVEFMRLGASDFLRQPVSTPDMNEFMARIREWEQAPAAPAAHKSICFFSPKGGTGATAVAVNSAAEANRVKKGRVLIADFVLQHGNVAHFLDAPQDYTVWDLAENIDRMDAKLLEMSAPKHVSGLSVLSCPRSPEEAENVVSKDTVKMVHIMRESFETVIFDAGHEFSTAALSCLDASEYVYLVATPEFPSVCNARSALAMFRKLGYPKTKVRVVLNRWKMKGGLEPEAIEKTLETSFFFKFPDDPPLLLAAINQGVPVAQLSKNSELAKAFAQFAEKMEK